LIRSRRGMISQLSLNVDWKALMTRRSEAGILSSGMSSGIRRPIAEDYGIKRVAVRRRVLLI
ncbi:MAG: hypothetical protein QF637_04220, partial [Acidimicrobiales bacterium]|nr:hypothetical protein [Acidimicrobiales bacterium]